MTNLILLVLIAVAAFFIWKAWDPASKTFNWHNGAIALAAVAAAVWTWIHDASVSLISGQ